MKNTQPFRIRTVAQYHEMIGLPKPEHPLMTIIELETLKPPSANKSFSLTTDFYAITLKRNFNGKLKYGQQDYDFDKGILLFMAPGQVFSVEVEGAANHSGWLLLVHPDYLWNTPLAKLIKHYDYFGYAVNEALHLSEREEGLLVGILQNIAREHHANIDKFSQPVIIAQLELLLTYADRFYHRQFITRKISNHQILSRLEDVLAEYVNSSALTLKGLPTVQFVAEALHVSPNYLSAFLKELTGQSTQQHIQDKVIDKAKEKLSTTGLSVGEIAYQLGFEHSQSFSKLFKSKTNLSPLDFRRSFN